MRCESRHSALASKKTIKVDAVSPDTSYPIPHTPYLFHNYNFRYNLFLSGVITDEYQVNAG